MSSEINCIVFFFFLRLCPPLIKPKWHSSIPPNFPTHPRSPTTPPLQHAPPQVNRKLKWLCLGWWSGGFPSNSVRMPHIHLPLAYSNQPFIIDAHTHAHTHSSPSSTLNRVSVTDVHTDTQSLYPSITTRRRSDSSRGTWDTSVLILFEFHSALSKCENMCYN